MTQLELFDLGAVAFCAAAGALSALRLRLDWFAAVLVGTVTAMGGGTLRDVLLGALPVYWIVNPRYLVACVATALGVCVVLGQARSPRSLGWITFADSLSLGLFTVLGAQKTLELGHGPLTGITMGIFTGCIGGVLRDVLCRRTPWIFRSELYATASLAGAVVFVILFPRVAPGVAMWAAFLTVVAIRLAAVRWNIHLPRGASPGPSRDSTKLEAPE